MTTGRISAGNNLTIDMASDRWRLLVNGDSAERVLVEATPGQPLRYLPTFGQRRRLPDTGMLPVLYIQRVVLGWSVKDESWHLGLVLEPELAQARGSRWCEVAHWPDPERDLYIDVATQAATSLAQTLTRPFELIPPREDAIGPVAAVPPVPIPLHPETAPAPAYAPTYAPPVQRPLPSLPVTLDDWQLSQTSADTLEFKRSSAWTWRKLLRVFWYILFTVIYLVLSITTLQGRIALPKPEFLPYLGLASAAILFLLAVGTVFSIGRTPNRVLVQSGQGVTALRGRGQRWHVPAGEIESVYASQVVSRKARNGKRTVHHGELNLLQVTGKFRFVLESGRVEEQPLAADEEPIASETVAPLTDNGTLSNVQLAAAHVARMLGRPAWYDQRLK